MFIPIRAPIFSLLVTFSFVATELCALWAAKTVTFILETRLLRRNVRISLLRHCRRLRIIGAFVLVSFLAFEILTSTFTQSAFRDEKDFQNCLRLVPLTSESKPKVFYDLRSGSILFRCLSFDGLTFEQNLGNFSLETSQVSCEKQRHYSYNNSERLERPTSAASQSCTNMSELDFSGEEKVFKECILYEVDGNNLYLSADTFEEPPEKTNFLVTKLSSDDASLIPKMVDRYLHFLLEDRETDELYARQVAFTDLVQSQCSFSTGRIEGVLVSSYLLAAVALLWFSAVLSTTMIIAFIRGKKPINLSDPFFWASKNLEQGIKLHKRICVDEFGVVTTSDVRADESLPGKEPTPTETA